MRPDGRSLIALGVVLGLISGLTEGVGHMVLQRLNVLDNSWYPIIWSAAVFYGLALGGVGLLAATVASRHPGSTRLLTTGVFSLFFLSIVPVMALMLKEWIYTYAILLLAVGTATALTRWQLRQEQWRFVSARSVRWAVGLTLLAFAIIEGSGRIQERVAISRLPVPRTSTPDVLLIIVDTLRSDHLSSYGYSRRTSPAIDALASGGVLFENSFATSSYTLPSHVSILTGQFPRDHGVEWGTSHRWPAQAGQTLPQVLQTLGYRTGAFSANTFYFTREHGFGRGFLHFEDFFYSLSDMAWRTAYGAIATRLVRQRLGWEDLPARKRAADVSESAARWIDRDTDRPFFVTLNYMDAHDPYLPPEPYRSRFATKPNPGGLINSKWHIPRTLPPDQLQSEQDAYDGAIAYIDDQISRLLSTIKSMSRPRDLLVIVTADHGEEFGEHGGFLHQRHLYREVLQVPLIVWAPGRVPGGKRVSAPVSNAAIPATVAGLLDAGREPFPSPSLQPLWEGTRTAFPAPLSELKHMPWAWPSDAPIKFGSMRSLVDESWHYIERDGRAPELFAWPTDRSERSNLADAPELQGVIERFRKLMK
ncbi:MAG: sulfatase [Vicinamibacterales bacterium]